VYSCLAISSSPPGFCFPSFVAFFQFFRIFFSVVVCPEQEVLIGNYSSIDSSSSSSSSSAPDSQHSSDVDHDSPIPHQQQQQQQQQDGHSAQELPALEIRSFKLHPSGSHIAVGVRRQGVCAVGVYKMPTAAAAAAVRNGVGTDAGPRVVTLRSNPSNPSNNSSSNSDTGRSPAAAAAAAAATASAAAMASLSAASLSRVLVLEEPTLVLDVIGVMTHDDAMGRTVMSNPSQDYASDDGFLVVSVSGITSPTAVYYISLQDPEQQVKVRPGKKTVRPGGAPFKATSAAVWGGC
jgi:hypothetical protein